MYRFAYHILQLAFIITAFTALVSAFGFRKSRGDFLSSSRRGVVLTFGLLSFASAILVYALLAHDFRLEYVAGYTSTTLPPFYSLSAFWAGQKGSLLFWAWILSGFTALVIYQNREKNQHLMPYVVTTLMTIEGFFLLLMLVAENPFETLAFTPADGSGLNPLLQNPGMVMHPPSLYLGYIGFSIPFAFAVAALLTRRLDSQWITTTRKWTIIAWFFLTLGNLFGMKWAYVELGWGGFWAWDPVENASFLPWLTGTAFLHSVMIQERRGMLKVWNVSLVVITFLLTILGTFLTRSGIISSVHSFGKSAVGPFFLWGILGTAGFAFWLILTRLPDLRSEHQLDSLLSRESSFLLNNLLLLGAAFAVLWGTLFPMISEAVTGAKVTVGAPFFNQVGTPIFLALLLLTGICPLIAWRKATGKNFRRNFLWPFTLSLLGGITLWIVGLRDVYIWMSFVFAIFVLYSVGMEFWKGIRAKMRAGKRAFLQALDSLVRSNQRRYGGYVVHLGLVMIFVGITGAVGFKTEQKIQLSQGQSATIKDYTIQLAGLYTKPEPGKVRYGANLDVYKNGALIARMTPEKRIHKGREEQPHTEVALRQTPKEDLYIIYAGTNGEKKAVFDVHINPLTAWIWAGGMVMALGTFLTLYPFRKRNKKDTRREKHITHTRARQPAVTGDTAV